MNKRRFLKAIGVIVIAAMFTGILMRVDEVEAGVAAPKPLSPKGRITDRTPTYKWNPITLGTKYRFQVIKDGSVIYTKSVTSSVCSGGKCTYTPAFTLDYGDHKWRVRGYESGIWSDYSPKKAFKVVKQPPGFDSQFTSDADGWKQYLASWKVKNGNYYTKGKEEKWATAGHSGEYLNFTYTARVKRTGCDWCANSLIIRGTPKPLHGDGVWDSGYYFQITNDKRFSVFVIDKGLSTTLKPWTITTHLNSFGWNKIKIVAQGKQFKFYINNNLVWKGNDPKIVSGIVGLAMYRGTGSDPDELRVDWAKLELSDN